MKLLISTACMAIMSAVGAATTRESAWTSKTLISDDNFEERFQTGTRLNYRYKTKFQIADDGTSSNTLVGEIELVDLQTRRLDQDKRDSIRISIGWRNPQEDGYDVHNIDIAYHRDPTQIKYSCIDGYSNGSLSTKYFQGGTGFNKDNQGRHNITIKEWTDNYDKIVNNLGWREPEQNDCTIVSGTTNGRQDYGDTKVNNVQDKDVKQTFKIVYTKPFKGFGIQDVTLEPNVYYNLTSYFGCYRSNTDNVRDGTNPDQFRGGDNWGCRGSWQGQKGTIVYTRWDGRQLIDQTRDNEWIEGQTKVLLLSKAVALSSMLASTAVLAVSAFSF